jgi:hypothetical protein
MAAIIGVFGSIRAAGSEVEIPSMAEARADFDEWLWAEPEEVVSDGSVIKRALGLRG